MTTQMIKISVTNDLSISYTVLVDRLSDVFIVYGTLSLPNEDGSKDTYNFVYNKVLDFYPRIKGRAWDKKEMELLKSLLDYYLERDERINLQLA